MDAVMEIFDGFIGEFGFIDDKAFLP